MSIHCFMVIQELTAKSSVMTTLISPTIAQKIASFNHKRVLFLKSIHMYIHSNVSWKINSLWLFEIYKFFSTNTFSIPGMKNQLDTQHQAKIQHQYQR